MTDARVTINGRSAGPLHQGGYYAFKYDITKLLKPAGQKNEIQVDVDDDSRNDSVNHAERRGDFWNYGGIFRPVYLEAVPRMFVDRLAISATAAGSLDVDVALSAHAGRPRRRSSSLSGCACARQQRQGPLAIRSTLRTLPLTQSAHLSGTVPNPQLWTAETPNLYQLEVQLKSGHAVVHTVHQKFGFRTIELRPDRACSSTATASSSRALPATPSGPTPAVPYPSRSPETTSTSSRR